MQEICRIDTVNAIEGHFCQKPGDYAYKIDISSLLEPNSIGHALVFNMSQKIIGRDVTVERDYNGVWRRSMLAFGRWYGDYGGLAYVDFRLRRFNEQTVVVAFMYTDSQSQEETIKFILDSFHMKR